MQWFDFEVFAVEPEIAVVVEQPAAQRTLAIVEQAELSVELAAAVVLLVVVEPKVVVVEQN